MAKNYFSGIITSDLKNLFTDALKALIEGGAGTIPCSLYYGITKWESCPNCLYDPIGKKSSNRFQNGGPVPFQFGGICPVCNGDGKRPVITTDTIDLVVIFDYREFVNMSIPVNNPEGFIQTMGTKEATPKLKRAKEIKVATDIAGYADHRFQRVSEPEPLGFGNNEFVICTWKRVM